MFPLCSNFPYPLRKSSRTALKRRVRWEEEGANLAVFDQPDNFNIGGVPHQETSASPPAPASKKARAKDAEGLVGAKLP